MEGMLTDLLCAVHLNVSRQYAASVFSIQLVVRIHGNLLQQNIGVISVEYIETIMNNNL